MLARHTRRVLVLLALGALLVAGLLSPGRVAAHAALTGTMPQDGEVLDTAPDTVVLTFDEPVSVMGGDSIQLFDGSGVIDALDAAAAGSEVAIELPDDLEYGSYTVTWRVTSDDGHPVNGDLTFSVGGISGTPIDAGGSGSSVMAEMGIVTGIAYLGLLLAVGIIWFRVFVVREVDARSVRIARVAAVVTGVAHLLLIPLTAIRDAGASIGDVVDPAMWKVDGLSLELRALIFVVAGLIFEVAYASQAPGRRKATWAVALGGLLALGSLTIVGHSTAVGPRWLMHGADFVHGAAGAFWFGGLVGLSLHLARTFRHQGGDGHPTVGVTTGVVSRFSSWAGLFFVGLALSGVVMAVRILQEWEALWQTTYGKVLIAKVLIVLLPLALAAWNKFRLVPAIGRQADDAVAWRHLRTTVLVEAGLLVVILGVTGFLVLQNPKLPEAAAAEGAVLATLPYAQTSPLGDGSLYLRISPADTGENDVTIAVMDAGRGPVELVDAPQVRLTLPGQGVGPLSTTLKPESDPGHYAGSVQFPAEGEWRVEVVTRVSKYEEPITAFEVTIPYIGEATPVP